MSSPRPRFGDALRFGGSLRETLEAEARRTKFPNVVCKTCRTSPYPRGYVVNLCQCWTCAFPCYVLLDSPDEET